MCRVVEGRGRLPLVRWLYTCRIERHHREESIMKGRLITVYILVVTASAVLAPIAAAGRNWP